MRESITTPSNYPPRVGKFTAGQIAQRATWGGVPDDEMSAAAMHVIHVRPAGASTITIVNPLDPASVPDGEAPHWKERPSGYGYVARHRPANWMMT